jgi:DNA-directed RNA polymerase subunit L
MINIKNVWALLEHSGFENDSSVISVESGKQEVFLSIEDELEGKILLTFSLSDAIKLKNVLDGAITDIFNDVRSLERDYIGGDI